MTVPVAVSDEETLHRIVVATDVRGDKPHFMAFYSKTVPHRMSVDRARYRPEEETLRDAPPGSRLAALQTGNVRQVDVTPALRVESLPENGNEAHAEIIADESLTKNKMKTKVCVLLADISRMI